MSWAISILSVFSIAAAGQVLQTNQFDSPVFDQATHPQIGDLDITNFNAYDHTGTFSRSGGREFPVLKEDLTVRIKPPLPIYSDPGLVRNSDSMKFPRAQLCPYKPGQPELTGKVLWVASGVMAVKLDQGPNFCGTEFNSREEVRDIIFVNTDHIASLDRTEDLKTEAGLPECSGPNCRKEAAMNDLIAALYTMKMGVKCEDVADFKSTEQVEAYLACYSTAHQDDYNSSYRQLIDLAAAKMTISFDSNAADPKVPVIEPLNFANEADDPFKGMDRSKLPLLVTPNATVLKCIARRESKWDRNVSSPTGARGIGQQTKINIEAINEYLQKDSAARAVWSAYFRAAKESIPAAQWKKLTVNTSTPGTVTSCPQTEQEWNKPIQLNDAYCPMTSIAAMALYQMMVEFAIRDANPKYRDHSFTAEEYSSVAQLMSISHNAGITAVRKAAQNSSTKFWVGNLMAQDRSANRAREVANYGEYMRYCLSGDSDRAWKSIDGGKDLDCSAFKPPKDCK